MGIHTATGVLLVVLLRCKSDKTLTINVGSEWIVARDDHIYPHVKLVAKEQQRVVNISANNACLMFWNKLQLIQDENALSLTRALWLDYPQIASSCLLYIPIVISALLPYLVLLILKIFFKLFLLIRKDESLWDEIEIGF